MALGGFGVVLGKFGGALGRLGVALGRLGVALGRLGVESPFRMKTTYSLIEPGLAFTRARQKRWSRPGVGLQPNIEARLNRGGFL